MKPTIRFRSFLTITGSSLLAMSSANALTYYWDGTSATWNSMTNWSTVAGATTPDPGALPLIGDDLIFNITGLNNAQNITLDAAQAAKSLTSNTTGATNIRGNSSGTTARILTLGSGGITLASGAGAVTIGEASATYGAVNITMQAAQTWKNGSTNLLQVNGNVDNGGNLLTIGDRTTHGPMSIGGVISGGGGITITSKTRLVLGDANEFTGAITLQGFGSGGSGTIAFTSIADFGSTTANSLGKAASGSIKLGNGSTSIGRLEYIGTTNSESNRTIEIVGTATNAGQILNNGTGTIKFDATTFNVNNGTGAHSLLLSGSNTGDNEISGIITNGVTSGTNVLSLNKTGAGKWILSGNNTYGGATSVSGGELVLSGNNSYTGTTTVSGGKLVLSGANTPGASNTSISGGGELVLDYSSQDNAKIGTGALTLGTEGGTGGTITLTGGSHAQTVSATTLKTGGTIINRTSGTSTLNLGGITFTGSTGRGGTLSISADNVATTNKTNSNGILGGSLVVGDNWAVNSTNGAAGAIVGLTSYTALPTSGSVATTNYSVTNSLNLNGDSPVNSLKIIASADGQTLAMGTRDLNPTAINTVGGILFTAADNAYTYNITGTTGLLRVASANNDTDFFVNNGTLNVTARTGSGSGQVVKAGSGTLILGGDNGSTGANWSGAARVHQGILRLTHNNGAGTTGGGITVQNLAALELGNSVAIGAEILTITGTGVANAGALRNVASNTSSYAGAITIGVNGARINSDASGSLTLTAGIVTAAGRDVTIGGAGNTTVQTAAITGAGGLIKDGAGTTTLSFANTYTGATNINDGTLLISSTGSINGSSAVNINGGTFQYNGTDDLTSTINFISGTVAGTNLDGISLTIGAGQTLSPGNSPGTMVVADQTWANDGTYLWEINDANATAGADPGWDLLSGTGTLNITATSGNPFDIMVTSLNLGNTAGDATDFDETLSYNWLIADFVNPVTGFDVSVFNVDTSGFTNTFGGSFAIAQGNTVGGDNTEIYLTYTGIPEPSTALLGGLGVFALLLRRRRD